MSHSLSRRWLSSAIILALAPSWLTAAPATEKVSEKQLTASLLKAGKNRSEIQKALDQAPTDQKPGMRFLVAYMPERDLQSLTATFLTDQSRYAYKAWRDSAWTEQVPEAVFFNDVLPYASINEPTVRMSRPIWKSADDVTMPSDFLKHPDITCVLDAIRHLKREFGDEVAIVGKTMGPWTLGYHVFGVEPFLLMSLDDPGQTKLCLERMKEITIAFGQAQIDAGADALTLPDHATGDLVSGEYYREFLRDLHTELVDEIPIPLILHICGRTVDRMDYIAQTGLAAFHYDSKNDPAESMEIVSDRIALIGNINNPQTLFACGPEEVAAEVLRNLDAGVPLVGPECAIPLQTAIENLKEIPLTVQRWHAERANNTAAEASDL